MIRIETVRRYIIDNFLFGDDSRLDEGTSFLDEGIIDSTGVLELIMLLEDSFGITVEDDELVPENLDSLLNIAGYLDRKLADSGQLVTAAGHSEESI